MDRNSMRIDRLERELARVRGENRRIRRAGGVALVVAAAAAAAGMARPEPRTMEAGLASVMLADCADLTRAVLSADGDGKAAVALVGPNREPRAVMESRDVAPNAEEAPASLTLYDGKGAVKTKLP